MFNKFLIWFYCKIGNWNLRKSIKNLQLSNKYITKSRGYIQVHNDYMKKVRDLKGIK